MVISGKILAGSDKAQLVEFFNGLMLAHVPKPDKKSNKPNDDQGFIEPKSEEGHDFKNESEKISD